MNKKNDKCQSCGYNFYGKYCSNCGEKQFSREDLSLKKSFKNFIFSISNIDSNLFKSLVLLLKKPGFLTKEYLNGKRTLYLKPLQLFLLINLLYFLIQPFTIAQGFNNTLNSQIHRQIYSSLTRKIIETKLQNADTSQKQEYNNRYNSKSETFAKSLLLLMVPFLALLLKLLYLKSGKYFVEHLIFSLHFLAFNLLINFIVLMLVVTVSLYLLNILGLGFIINELLLLLLSSTISFIYLYSALKRVYAQSKLVTVIKSFLITFSLFPIIFIYRFILFFITYIFVG